MVLALAVAACATPQTDALRQLLPAEGGLSPARELQHVPFHAQSRYQCGPATLAMALGAAGAVVAPDALVDEVYLPSRHGSLALEMLAAARRHQRLAIALPPRLNAVLQEVDAGTPVIVLQNLGLSLIPVWHYALVIGYDIERDRIVLHSGTEEHATMPLEVFERTWTRGGSWAMIVVAPGQLPATLPPAAVVEAAAALERVAPAAARGSWIALTDAAPALYPAWMGLGNTAFAAGDVQAALAAFERATRLQPAQGDAWNNLATALLADSRAREAQQAIRRALELGGPHRQTYEQTAAEVERALR